MRPLSQTSPVRYLKPHFFITSIAWSSIGAVDHRNNAASSVAMLATGRAQISSSDMVE